jgi:hypothetical protein
MNLIDNIKTRLSKYPDIRYESDASSITVFPHSPDGFAVTLVVNGGNVYTISFAGWHEDFEGEEEAQNAFAFGLSYECRLKEYRRGNFAYKWTVEYLDDDGQWKEESTTGLLLFPFWKRSTVRYLQNNLLRRETVVPTVGSHSP